MDNRAGEMQVFVRVVETGSFSAAARQLRMTPSTISKLVGRIESRLGVRLLERSTRRLSVTAEGQVYFERSRALLQELERVEGDLADGAAAAFGTVRVTASVAFGTQALEPLLPQFWEAHPNVVVDLSLSDEIVDLYLDRTDVAFRIGPLQDSTLVARRLGATRRKIVASPRYLRRHGRPKTLEDLARHNCLGFNFRRATPTWSLREGDQPVEVAVGGSLLANNGETVRRMAVAGVGLARLGEFNVREDLANGRLVEVLPDAVEGVEEPIHALYLGGPRLAQRVRVFLDYVCPRLSRFVAEKQEEKPQSTKPARGSRVGNPTA